MSISAEYTNRFSFRGALLQFGLARRKLLGAPVIAERIAHDLLGGGQRLDRLDGHVERHPVAGQEQIPHRVGRQQNPFDARLDRLGAQRRQRTNRPARTSRTSCSAGSGSGLARRRGGTGTGWVPRSNPRCRSRCRRGSSPAACPRDRALPAPRCRDTSCRASAVGLSRHTSLAMRPAARRRRDRPPRFRSGRASSDRLTSRDFADGARPWSSICTWPPVLPPLGKRRLGLERFA